MSLLDEQPDHIKLKAKRMREQYHQLLFACKMDRNVALLHACALNVQLRDYLSTKTGMHSDRLDKSVQKHFESEGYLLAIGLLVEDFKRFRDKVMAQNIGTFSAMPDRVPDVKSVEL